MTLRYWETYDKITVFFADVKIPDDAQIQEIDGGLLDICERAANTAKMLRVDLRGVQFISSAMIGEFLLLNKAATKQSLDLRFANVSAGVLEVFRIVNLSKVLRMDEDDPESGLEFLGSGVPKPQPPGSLDCRAKPR